MTVPAHIHYLSLHAALPIFVEVAIETRRRESLAIRFCVSHHWLNVKLGTAGSLGTLKVAACRAPLKFDNVRGEAFVRGAQIGRAQSELQSRGHLVCRLLLEK